MILKKYNTNPELWKLIHSWLHLLGNKPNAKYCKEEITTHPDYPAITAVTDFLDIGNMEYNAVEADLSYINEFNYPLLAHIQLPGRQFLYPINNILDWKLKNDITKNWSGVVIYPEKNSSWENNHNKSYINKSNKLKISNIILAILIFGILVISLSYQTTLISIYFGILSMFGLFLSVFLLGSELGYQNEILNQVCGDASGSGCQHILRTKYAKGLFGITPADASLLYFFTQFALFLFNPLISSILNSLYLISVIVFPIISVWSIYTQAVKIKKWCLLCLAIIGILFLQFTIVLFTSSFNLIATNSILILLITITLFLILFIRLKQLLKSNNLNLQKLSQYHKWKADAGLFLIQLNKQPSCDIALFDNDILFGNKSAPLRITIACNPYCNPCAKTHKVLDKIVDRFWDKVSIQVRLLCDTHNYEDEVTIATKAILQKVEVLNDSIQIQEMLSDWFEWMDFKKWNVKWEVSNSVDVTNSLLEHENWMDESKISYTPTIFLNGKKIPSQYSIEDIEKMIPELIVYF